VAVPSDARDRDPPKWDLSTVGGSLSAGWGGEFRASCDGYLFWDHIHPTARAHARIADAAFRILSEQ
jgi:phospholipase/lecithinase/hemolysin